MEDKSEMNLQKLPFNQVLNTVNEVCNEPKQPQLYKCHVCDEQFDQYGLEVHFVTSHEILEESDEECDVNPNETNRNENVLAENNPNVYLQPRLPTTASEAAEYSSPVILQKRAPPTPDLHFIEHNVYTGSNNYGMSPNETLLVASEASQDMLHKTLNSNQNELHVTHYSKFLEDTEKSKIPEQPPQKPPFSYSCLIFLALKNSESGRLSCPDIFKMIVKYFPYFKTVECQKNFTDALCRKGYFEKVPDPITNLISKSNKTYGIKPDQYLNLDEKVKQCVAKNSVSIEKSLAKPYSLPDILKGKMQQDVRSLPTQEISTLSYQNTTRGMYYSKFLNA